MDTKELVRRVKVLRGRPSRLVDRLREPRDLVVGGTFLNGLGLQVARTLIDRAAWELRSPQVTHRVRAAYDTLHRDGVVVIPDFLPPADFDVLRQEVSAAIGESGSPKHRRLVFGDNFEVQEIIMTDWPTAFPNAMGLVRDSRFLSELASAVSRRSMTYKPHVLVYNIHKPSPQDRHTDMDYNQYVHADRHYPFIKAFFYMNDVDEATAPYCYARRSHLVDARRLEYEYRYSLAYCEARGSKYSRSSAQLERDAKLRELAESYLREIGSHCEPIIAKANTMVVSNNMGFHKRAPMLSSGPRITLNVDFKYLESPAQWLFPILGRL